MTEQTSHVRAEYRVVGAVGDTLNTCFCSRGKEEGWKQPGDNNWSIIINVPADSYATTPFFFFLYTFESRFTELPLA